MGKILRLALIVQPMPNILITPMVQAEIHQRLKFNRRGLVGMAGEAKEGNASQFFITLGSSEGLNGRHTLFGKVVSPTVFNVMELNKYEVDKNDRPTKLHKILKAKVG